MTEFAGKRPIPSGGPFLPSYVKIPDPSYVPWQKAPPMPLDPRAERFLGQGPRTVLENQRSTGASERILAYRNREFVEKTGRIAEELLGFLLEQRQRKDWLDDEVIGGVALFTINLRESFGQPQHTTDDARWTPEFAKEQLAIFDTICGEMQEHFDRNKHRARTDGWDVK